MTNGAFPGELSDLVGKLSQNPELREMIASLVRQNGGERQTETHPDSRQSEAKAPVPDLSALASFITPEMMAALPSLMSALGASGAQKGGAPNEETPNGASSAHGENADASRPPDGGKTEHTRKRCGEGERRALLNALRPFLNENRCRALDMMIGMEKLGLVRTMKG